MNEGQLNNKRQISAKSVKQKVIQEKLIEIYNAIESVILPIRL